jgi:hypothetical protein
VQVAAVVVPLVAGEVAVGLAAARRRRERQRLRVEVEPVLDDADPVVHRDEAAGDVEVLRQLRALVGAFGLEEVERHRLDAAHVGA